MLIDEDWNCAHVLYRAFKTFKSLLILNLTFLGTVPYDARIHDSLIDRMPFLAAHPASDAAASFRHIAKDLAASGAPAGRQDESREPDAL